MRRIVRLFTLLAAIALPPLLGATPASAQSPPQAWLFGEWIGGIYPPPSTVTAQECLAQPVVIFTRDIVMRAVITDQQYIQRLVETARVTAAGVEFRFAPSLQVNQPGPFGQDQGSCRRGWFRLRRCRRPARAAAWRERDQLPRLPRIPVLAGALSRPLENTEEIVPR